MGIRGLLTMIKGQSVFDMVNLVEQGKRSGGIEILVDFHAIIRFIIETFTKKISMEFENEFLLFPIGVYDIFAEAVTDLHQGFNDAGIRLVWIVDGPKGVDELASEQKEETWVSRDKEDAIMMDKVLSACRKKVSLQDIKNLGPIAHFEAALSALKKAGAEIINLLQGEADDFIAYEFHRRKSFAILTNDTDFVIFRDCVVIFEQLLSLKYDEDNLKLPFVDNDNPGKIFQSPTSLYCPIVTQSHILKLFKFNDYNQMIALSILKGNDYTGAFASELQHYLKISKYPNHVPHITRVADFIKRRSVTGDNLDQLPEMRKFMVNYPQLQDTIRFTKDLYMLRRIKENMKNGIVIYDPTTTDDSLTGFLAKKLANGEISKKIYSIHYGIIHDSVCMEKATETCPLILSLLSKIRTLVYPYLLNKRLGRVIEWRSRCTDTKVVVPVVHAQYRTHLIKGRPDDEGNSPDKYGIDIFEEIISHHETDGSKNYVKKYGIEKAFVCYILRYFYVLTKEKNLRVTNKEFRGLFVTVFYQFGRYTNATFKTKLNRDIFLGLKICPSERCVIIADWFMNIYFTAKYLCGGALNITEDFPMPSQIMNGAVMYGFYENLMADDNDRISHLEDSLIESVTELEEELMTLYEEEYKAITEMTNNDFIL